MFLSALTLLELENAAAIAARRDKAAGAAWRDWLDRQVVPAFEGRILPVDAAVIRRRAQLRTPTTARDCSRRRRWFTTSRW